jgi:hypothetical protein
MTGPDDEDDKPTVVLDLNALKKQKLKQEEELANIAQELEFAASTNEAPPENLPEINHFSGGEHKEIRVILFDFQSNLFEASLSQFPQDGFEFHIARTLPELNKLLAFKETQIVIFNYDANPKAVGQLCAQIKVKFPLSNTIIMANNISPEKAKIHAKSPAGAKGYYQLPLDKEKMEKELLRVFKS